jgi:hypothetical protein
MRNEPVSLRVDLLEQPHLHLKTIDNFFFGLLSKMQFLGQPIQTQDPTYDRELCTTPAFKKN